MMTFSGLAVGSMMVLAVDAIPTFNVEPSCKVAGNTGGDLRREACLRTEREAREQLGKNWSGYLVADRSSCLQTSTMGGASRSYVELLTCLEIFRDARKLPKDTTAPIESAGSPRRGR